MKKYKIILPEKRYAKAPEEELDLNLNLRETSNNLINDDRNIVLDSNAQFDKERNESIKYKIYGKINMIFRNLYYGTTQYEYLNDIKYDKTSTDENDGYLPYDTFAFLRRDMIREIAVPSSSGSGLEKIIINPKTTEHNTITEENFMNANWNLYLSYAFDEDANHPMNYTTYIDEIKASKSFVSGDGIPFKVTNSGYNYILTSPVDHGMSEGEYIIIDNKAFYINGIGNENYNSEKYVLLINKNQISSDFTGFNNDIIVGKRCLDITNKEETTSKYYIHKNKILTSINDYAIEKIGFEQPIFKDEIKNINKNGVTVKIEKNRPETVLFDFENVFVLSGLTNNLGYLPTEINVSAVYRNTDGFFNYPPKVGYGFNIHDNWVDDYWDDSNNTEEPNLTGADFTKSTYTFTSGNTLNVGDILIGDFIEYSPTEMKERTISNAYHKLTSPTTIFNHGQDDEQIYKNVSATNMFGLLYKTHYKINLRQLSPKVETSNNNNIDNLPQNAKFYENEKIWKWRDLYDHGYIDDLEYGTNFPFINGMHYVKKDFNLYLINELFYNEKTNGIRDFNNYLNKNTLSNKRDDRNNNSNILCD